MIAYTYMMEGIVPELRMSKAAEFLDLFNTLFIVNQELLCFHLKEYIKMTDKEDV